MLCLSDGGQCPPRMIGVARYFFSAVAALASAWALTRAWWSARMGLRRPTPMRRRMFLARPSWRTAGRPSLRLVLELRALIRCEVLAWWRLSLPFLVTLKRLAMLLFGF